MRLATTALVTAMSIVPVIALAHGNHSHRSGSGGIKIEDTWIRATPPSADVAGAYMTLTNEGQIDDRLTGGSSPVAEKVEIHSMEMNGSVMTMRMLSDGLDLPGGESVVIKPGGFHVMLIGLSGPIRKGDRVPLTLTFANSDPVELSLEATAIGSKGIHENGEGHDSN